MKKFYTLLITAIFGFAFSQNTVYFIGGTFNWQFPPLVNTAQVSAWGGGGGGGSVNNSNGAKAGGGGGGGAFAQVHLPLPQEIYIAVMLVLVVQQIPQARIPIGLIIQQF